MALNPQQERVAELIASGCTPAQVAGATGFSLGYISQLGNIEEFKELVVGLAGERVEQDISRQDSYDSLESGILSQMQGSLGTMEANELTRALDVVAKNNPKRNNKLASGEGADVSVSVTLNLPPHVLMPLEIKTDSRNRVIEVGAVSMLPLTQKDVRTRLQEINASREF